MFPHPEMEARLASRRFYLARALTPSHKSTLPSPAYSPPSIVPFLPPPRSLLIGRSGFTREAFSLPLAAMRPLQPPRPSPILPPSSTDDEGAAPESLWWALP